MLLRKVSMMTMRVPMKLSTHNHESKQYLESKDDFNDPYDDDRDDAKKSILTSTTNVRLKSMQSKLVNNSRTAKGSGLYPHIEIDVNNDKIIDIFL